MSGMKSNIPSVHVKNKPRVGGLKHAFILGSTVSTVAINYICTYAYVYMHTIYFIHYLHNKYRQHMFFNEKIVPYMIV